MDWDWGWDLCELGIKLVHGWYAVGVHLVHNNKKIEMKKIEIVILASLFIFSFACNKENIPKKEINS